ncbi:hypothetical protein EI94DRAFT_1758482 [Lactarius quietus]|nr:hypothetical protein EI94DRAFT_1758482 [Lactarius quietus]
MDDQDQYIHLKEIFVDFIKRRPTSDLELVFKDDAGVKHKSDKFKESVLVHWNFDIYVRVQTSAMLTIHRVLLSRRLNFVKISVKFTSEEFGEDKTVSLEDSDHHVTMNFICGKSKTLADVTRVLGSQACTALASKINMLDGLDKILGFLTLPQLASPVAQLNPVASIAVSIVTQVIANFQAIPECHKQFIILMDDLVSMLPIMQQALEAIEVADRCALVRGFIEFVKETSEQLNKYASRPNSVFLLENWYKSKKGEVDALREKSARLKQNVDLAISVDIEERQRLADEQRMLDRIKPPEGSFFNPDPEKCCIQDTRANLIKTLVSFAVSEDTSQRLFLLYGIAGCGKTSVATSVADSLRQRNCLLGVPAYLLHTPYKTALLDVLKKDPVLERKGPSTQFEELLKKPLSDTSHPPSSNRAIVIDALDECDDPQLVSSYLADIVRLAPWLKVIVTSRPLGDIVENLSKASYMQGVNLFDVGASEDILKFITSRFAPGGPAELKVETKDIKALAEKSHGLFIWIKTVLSYLDDFPITSDKLEELKSILSSPTAPSPEKELDQLYLRVLRGVARSQHYQVAVKNLVGFIYTTSRNRPLPCTGLHAFIPTPKPNSHVTPDDVHRLQSKLAAVITIDPVTKALQVCHPSFLDFVASEERSQEFSTKPEVLDTMMAERCFSLLKAGQKSDICRRGSSRDGIPVLQQIPQELHYSAVYWLDHLFRSPDSGSSDEKLIAVYKDACEFLNHGGLLYLLNVLNLVSEINAAAQVLLKAYDVISKTGRLTHRPEAELFNRIRLLIIGRSAVGKTSLINRVFGIRPSPFFEASNIQQEYVTPESQLVVLHESNGFEPGDLSNFETVREFLLQRSRQELPLSERIHVIWLCIETSTVGGRVHEIGDEKLLKFAHEKQIPIVLVFTQYDRLVRTKEVQLRGIRDMDLTHRRERSVEEARKAFEETLRSLQSTMDQYRIPMPPYVTVSLRRGYEESVLSLLKMSLETLLESSGSLLHQ